MNYARLAEKRRLCGCPWTLAVTLCALAATAAAQTNAATWLICRVDGVQQGELWRLMTGPLVHAGWGHALRDLAGLLFIGILYEPLLRRRFVVVLLSSIAIAPLAVFFLDHSVTRFFGLSGTVHALLTAALVWQWKRGPSWWVVGLSTVLLVKLAFESAAGTLLFPLELPPGVQPAVFAHVAGAACGLLATWPERAASGNAAGVPT